MEECIEYAKKVRLAVVNKNDDFALHKLKSYAWDIRHAIKRHDKKHFLDTLAAIASYSEVPLSTELLNALANASDFEEHAMYIALGLLTAFEE